MEREPAESTESIETAVQELARLLARHIESSDARLTRLEVNLLKLSDALGACVKSMNEFVGPSSARFTSTAETLQKLAQDVARLEQELNSLAPTVKRGDAPPRG